MNSSMTNEEAIKMLKSKLDGHTDTSWEWTETVRMSINALEIFEQAKEAGLHGKEVEFYIGGRKFAIRELAQ